MKSLGRGVALSIGLLIAVAHCEEPPVVDANVAPAALPSVEEARGRAELLHETIHATLQVVHRDFYHEDEGLPIPATSLGRVFRKVEERQNVKLRWLAVNADAMNVDHEPQDEFEKAAVEAMRAGQESHEISENGVYRRAGVITLSSECLKCHLPTRKSTANRAAGLVIAIPCDNE
jgi:hypothetical protein